jgi:hypothetical protein
MPEYSGSPLGYESEIVNGQLINVAPLAAFNPLVIGGAYAAPASWPRQGVWDVPPVMPSAAEQVSSTYGGFANGTTQYPTATDANGSPFSIKSSPLWWAVGGIVACLLFLHYVVYK